MRDREQRGSLVYADGHEESPSHHDACEQIVARAADITEALERSGHLMHVTLLSKIQTPSGETFDALQFLLGRLRSITALAHYVDMIEMERTRTKD